MDYWIYWWNTRQSIVAHTWRIHKGVTEDKQEVFILPCYGNMDGNGLKCQDEAFFLN